MGLSRDSHKNLRSKGRWGWPRRYRRRLRADGSGRRRGCSVVAGAEGLEPPSGLRCGPRGGRFCATPAGLAADTKGDEAAVRRGRRVGCVARPGAASAAGCARRGEGSAVPVGSQQVDAITVQCRQACPAAVRGRCSSGLATAWRVSGAAAAAAPARRGNDGAVSAVGQQQVDAGALQRRCTLPGGRRRPVRQWRVCFAACPRGCGCGGTHAARR